MNIGIILVHNKSDKDNAAQIATLKTLIEVKTKLINGLDDQGKVILNAYQQNYFSLIGLKVPHELYIYHVVPFQPDNISNPYSAKLPSGMYDIYSGGIQYGKGGGEAFIGDHPHFFNWGMERVFHENIDIMLYMQDVNQFSIQNFGQTILPLSTSLSPTEYAEDVYGKMCTQVLYKQITKIPENISMTQALDALKIQAIQGGMISG